MIGISPIKKKKIPQKRYSDEKTKSITKAISENIFHTAEVTDASDEEDDGSDILQILKDDFNKTKDHAKQMKILTIFKNWPFRKIIRHFPSATFHMITVAKKTAEEKGILSEPDPKSHPSLQKEVVDLIVSFYELDENSRVMPGKKDYVSVKVNNDRVQMQKRLLLLNLKELFQLFKEKYPQVKCSFSKFATLRPQYCVLAGASGTHSVCVCAIHENVKLLLDGPNMKNLTVDTVGPIKTYHDCLKRMICIQPSTECYFGTCSECPGITHLIEELENIFVSNSISEITYRQWIYVDRTSLQVLISPVVEYLQKLETGLQKLLLHSFLVKKQNEFMDVKKKELKDTECIVACDFSENYAFVFQNAVQGIHWNNDQATVHPFAIYYKHIDGETKMKSFVIISDCLKHDTIAVHVFQKYLVQFLKESFEKISKIIYFSDGAGAQYKNKKNFVNLTHHQKDFGLAAEWHFFPTSHGKGACDGLGGTLKRLAARASLQKATIQTPRQLFEWATTALPNISLQFVENEEYIKEEKKLKTRFDKAITIKGTLAYHCMIPITQKTAKAKHFSLQEQFKQVRVMK